MKAFLKNYRQSPRKVRLVGNLIKGKKVELAAVELKHLAKRAALPMEKLLASAVANAKQMGIDAENLVVKSVEVNQGIVMKRMMPRAFGRGAPIMKKSSRVTIILAEVGSKKAVKTEKVEKTEKAEKKPKVKVAKSKETKAKKQTKPKS